MSQSDLTVDTRFMIQVFENEFRQDAHYELRSASNPEQLHGVVDVHILTAGPETLTLEEARIKAAESAKNLLSMLVSHLQSIP